MVKRYVDLKRTNTRYHVQRRPNSEIPFKWVWRTVHGQRVRVRLYPPAGDPELLSVEERKRSTSGKDARAARRPIAPEHDRVAELNCADGGS